ncbi:PREDICTED: tumor protein p53-inducible protein 11-like [Priapulus caudatus]|uniref:Tumor protein p53-inducible protein 11 n=1 Tax=Priapulus caudatus TaxID=37621 RepID=A0ABM1ENE5_PRICU|nr:PREDICTED: tumor protein p53-inducible protein 11-like [Priapulus caudatus]
MTGPTAVTMTGPTAVTMTGPTAVTMTGPTAVTMTGPTAVTMTGPTAVTMTGPTAVTMTGPTAVTMTGNSISQILGHSEHLYSRLPRGLWYWQMTEAFSYALLALLALVLPGRIYSITLGINMENSESALGVRFYGAALACIAVLLWNVIGSTDKPLLRLSLMVSGVHYGIQILGVVITMVHLGHFSTTPLPLVLCRAAQAGVCHVYYHGLMKVYKSQVINPRVGGLRRAESFANLYELRNKKKL